MRSISFPEMFKNTNVTNVVDDENIEVTKRATHQNLKSLLSCEKGEMLGDPYFGISLKRYIFEPNNIVLRDLLIDEIYTAIAVFMPQIQVFRDNITILQDGNKLIARIRALNRLNYVTDLYNVVLLDTTNN